MWRCTCDCGNECITSADVLTRKTNHSCGCLAKEHLKEMSKNNITHGMTFQSTFPRGERRIPGYLLRLSDRFQSTFPRGERQVIPSDLFRLKLFQSTFPRGERLMLVSIGAAAGAFQSTFPRGERLQISTIFHLYICISSTNSHFSITSFCIFYLIHFFLICFFQLFMVRIFWGFSVYFWFALYRNNT